MLSSCDGGRGFGRRAWVQLVLGIATVAWSGAAAAQTSYESALLGGRSGMMGGAAVARGSDGAVLFLNPAGITRIPGESFSFGTVAMQFTERLYRGAIDPTGALDVERRTTHDLDFRVLPNTFCLFLDGPPKDAYSVRSRHKYGICVADIEQESFMLTQNERNPNTALALATRMNFRRVAAVASWGVELRPGTSLGVSARVENTTLDDATTSSGLTRPEFGDFRRTTDFSRRSISWDSGVTIGVTQLVTKNITLGLSLATPTQHIIGYHKGISSLADVANSRTELVQDEGDFIYNQPAVLRLGMAFTWPSFNLEVAGSFYSAQDSLAVARFNRSEFDESQGVTTRDSRTRAEISERARPITNIGLGIESFIERDFSILAGFQTDFSGLVERRDQRTVSTLFRQERDAFHVSLGVASYGQRGSILIGVRGTYSSGTILMLDPVGETSTFRPLPQTLYSISMVLSGQLSFEGVRDTAMRAASPFLTTTDVRDEDEGSGR